MRVFCYDCQISFLVIKCIVFSEYRYFYFISFYRKFNGPFELVEKYAEEMSDPRGESSYDMSMTWWKTGSSEQVSKPESGRKQVLSNERQWLVIGVRIGIEIGSGSLRPDEALYEHSSELSLSVVLAVPNEF
uniref:Uncharacterized protein n=1 Tax=Meloidogyne hapla TaxID=6305 RepID=A0A1I8BR71_MELHA